MTPRPAPAIAAGALALLLGLAACNGKAPPKDVDALDRELVGNGAAGDQTDPALTSALEDQIMVDPALTQQKGGAHPGAAPAQAPIPATQPGRSQPRSGPTLGELARAQAAPNRRVDCNSHFQYSLAWAQRLPRGVPLYPDAQVSEAAGNDMPGCALRVVSFVSAVGVQRLVDFYYTHTRRAGFAAEHKVSGNDHILAGERGDDAFYATFHAQQGGGTQVDLVVNAER